jgi:hypothetical protein
MSEAFHDSKLARALITVSKEYDRYFYVIEFIALSSGFHIEKGDACLSRRFSTFG